VRREVELGRNEDGRDRTRNSPRLPYSSSVVEVAASLWTCSCSCLFCLGLPGFKAERFSSRSPKLRIPPSTSTPWSTAPLPFKLTRPLPGTLDHSPANPPPALLFPLSLPSFARPLSHCLSSSSSLVCGYVFFSCGVLLVSAFPSRNSICSVASAFFRISRLLPSHVVIAQVYS